MILVKYVPQLPTTTAIKIQNERFSGNRLHWVACKFIAGGCNQLHGKLHSVTGALQKMAMHTEYLFKVSSPDNGSISIASYLLANKRKESF